MINTLFSDNEFPKERNHYICIAAICIESVLRVDKKLSSSLLRTVQILNKRKEASKFYRC